MRKSSRGFTLLEMMVVIIIITMVAGVSVAMLNVFLRGQGIRQCGSLISQTFAQTKQHAAETRVLHFIRFENHIDGYGTMTIFKDINGNKFLDNGDQELHGRPVALPKGVIFKKVPSQGWVGLEPSGYTTGFVDVPSSTFEKHMRDNEEAGDIILSTRGQPYSVCIDIDISGGKVRRAQFLTGLKEDKK